MQKKDVYIAHGYKVINSSSIEKEDIPDSKALDMSFSIEKIKRKDMVGYYNNKTAFLKDINVIDNFTKDYLALYQTFINIKNGEVEVSDFDKHRLGQIANLMKENIMKSLADNKKLVFTRGTLIEDNSFKIKDATYLYNKDCATALRYQILDINNLDKLVYDVKAMNLATLYNIKPVDVNSSKFMEIYDNWKNFDCKDDYRYIKDEDVLKNLRALQSTCTLNLTTEISKDNITDWLKDYAYNHKSELGKSLLDMADSTVGCEIGDYEEVQNFNIKSYGDISILDTDNVLNTKFSEENDCRLLTVLIPSVFDENQVNICETTIIYNSKEQKLYMPNEYISDMFGVDFDNMKIDYTVDKYTDASCTDMETEVKELTINHEEIMLLNEMLGEGNNLMRKSISKESPAYQRLANDKANLMSEIAFDKNIKAYDYYDFDKNA